jgi:D-alanyl-D-alanine endopeptidase (penicillin-binding protein 7)
MALMRATGLAPEDFIDHMNKKAYDLGLYDTHFTDPTGLDEGNVSSALDCAKLIETALQNELITSITRKKEYHCRSSLKKRPVHLYNTNRLLSNQSLEVLVGKTGFIRRSGYCLATCVGDGNGRKIAFIVLGAPSNTVRFQEMYKLIRWTAKNYNLAIS